jgi:phage-related protein
MAFDGSTTCWAPTLPISYKAKQRLDVSQFGDGYEQRTLQGINTMILSWDLKFLMKPDWVLVEMDLYLQALYGAAFPFLDPIMGSTVMVFCDEWQIDWEHRRFTDQAPVENFGTLSATFRRAYGVSLAPV